jgi:retrograde regulation protein 2
MADQKQIFKLSLFLQPSFAVSASNSNLWVNSDLAKEFPSAAALYSTNTGILASSHGVSHYDRALLALIF